MPLTPPHIKLEAVCCAHDKNTVLHGLSFQIPRGKIICFIGPSGCGKTTLLRAIAGLEPLQSGTISLRGKTVSSSQQQSPPDQRHLGMVFQDHALFPHMTLHDNICFGINKKNAAEKEKLVKEMLDFVEMPGFAGRYPHELSGGQQQRVALARTLARQTDIMLFDEPFSNQDVELRDRLRHRIVKYMKQYDITALFVTHDQQEAFALGDQVAVINHGRIEQWDTAYNVYHEPASRFVADFIGEGRFLKGTLIAPDKATTPLGEIRANRAYAWDIGTTLDILIRPDDVTPAPKNTPCLSGKITNKAFKGAEILYTLETNGVEILALFPSHLDVHHGETLLFNLKVDHLVAFANEE